MIHKRHTAIHINHADPPQPTRPTPSPSGGGSKYLHLTHAPVLERHQETNEIPGAYKDIDMVMANQNDLTKILQALKQVMCVKG